MQILRVCSTAHRTQELEWGTEVTLTTNKNIDELLFLKVTEFLAENDLVELRASMKQQGFALLRGLFDGDLLEKLRTECRSLMHEHGVERDFLMQQTANTPRRMLNVKRDRIKEHGALIPRIYESLVVRRLFGLVVQDEFHTCPFTPEEYIINGLFKSGDTHGWHWDDYRYGVVLAVDTPEKGRGGLVQVVPTTTWDRRDDCVENALCSGPCHSFRLQAGDAYVLKTDTGMHRVTPIAEGAHRIVVNMVWSTPSELNKDLSHDTMEALFS